MPLSSNIAKPIQKSKLLKIELKPILGTTTNVNIYGNDINPSPTKKKNKRKAPTPKHQHAGVCVCPVCERNKRLGKVTSSDLKPKPPTSARENFGKNVGSSKSRRFDGRNGRTISNPAEKQILETVIGGKKVIKTVENVTEDDIEMFALEYPRVKRMNKLRMQISLSKTALNSRRHPKGNRRPTTNNENRDTEKKTLVRSNEEEESKHLDILKEYQRIRTLKQKQENERIFNAYGREFNLEIVLNKDGKYVCKKIDENHDKNHSVRKKKKKKKRSGPFF